MYHGSSKKGRTVEDHDEVLKIRIIRFGVECSVVVPIWHGEHWTSLRPGRTTSTACDYKKEKKYDEKKNRLVLHCCADDSCSRRYCFCAYVAGLDDWGTGHWNCCPHVDPGSSDTVVCF